MSNSVLPVITIDLVLDRSTTKDVLQGVLNAILFHRLFGTIKPESFEVHDVTMPGIADPSTQQLISDKVDSFWKGIEGGVSKKGQIVVVLSERRPKKNWFSLAIGEEDVPWEQWVINAELRHVRTEKDRQIFNDNLTKTLNKAIFMMIQYTSSEQGRQAVPLITERAPDAISPFPFKIQVKVGDVEVG